MRMTTRAPAVAGTFYPDDPVVLSEMISALLSEAEHHETASSTLPKAIITPHAGYIYSGPIAASVYARLNSGTGVIRRVVLLGPAHRVPIAGLALPAAEAFATPLGTVSVDQDAVKLLLHLRQVTQSADAHAWEHSLEVQLPFLQQVLGDFKLVPLVVGDAAPEEVAEVLETLWGGPETLIVVSSDLSHYLPYELAQRTDKDTADNILALEASLNHRQACGAAPVNGLLLAARKHQMRARLIDLRNSGDTAGSHREVVGYGAFTFFEGS